MNPETNPETSTGTTKGSIGKKIALGCLGVLLLLSLAGGIIVYRFVIVPGRSMLQSAEALQQLETLNEDIRNQQPFTAPESLTSGHVDRFVVVQRQLLEQLEGQMNALETRYNQQEDMSLPEMLNAWQDITAVLVEAKQSQVAALNAANFSLAEYAWVRQQVFTALGYSNITALPGAQAPPETNDVSPEATNLVRPHQALLEQTVILSAFGL
jgi:hypothetical protein